MSDQKLEIRLPFGLPVNQGKDRACLVVFSKRPTAADSIKIEDDRQSELATQKPLMYARAAITQFGDRARPPYLTEMLSLNRADREVLIEGYLEFLELTAGDSRTETIDDDRLRLAFGLPHDGQTLQFVTLCDRGSELTGYEEQKIEREADGRAFEQTCITLGYDIAGFSDEEGVAVVEGPISLELLKQLDAIDLNDIMSAANKRRRLFRRRGITLPANDGARSSAAGS
jgi:hypothetical protein